VNYTPTTRLDRHGTGMQTHPIAGTDCIALTLEAPEHFGARGETITYEIDGDDLVSEAFHFLCAARAVCDAEEVQHAIDILWRMEEIAFRARCQAENGE
jgi:hypothetical protein